MPERTTSESDHEGPRTRVFTFARTFSNKEHAESFMRGHLRLQTVEHFRGLEDSEKALRGDAYEGISAIWQPKDLSSIVFGPHTLLPSDLTGPIKIHRLDVSSWHVFCMHTIGITPEDPSKFDSPQDLKAAIMLDERCSRFGEHVVLIHNKALFVERLEKAVKKLKLGYRFDLVRYFSEVEYSGLFPDAEVPFRKPKRFAYQKEYRVVVKTRPGVPTPLIIELGDISDVALRTTFGELKANCSLRLRDGTVV
jgi:hypothetical protein